MATPEDTHANQAGHDVRPWVFRIWRLFMMTVGALVGHQIAWRTFGHPKGQPHSVMYWYAGLIGLGALAGAVIAYATKSRLSVEERSAKR